MQRLRRLVVDRNTQRTCSIQRDMRLEKVIGQNIRRAREAEGLSQAQLGKLVGQYLGADWPRQAVSAAEQGNRAFAAAELVALALAMGRSVTWLLTPQGRERVELPGKSISARELPLALESPHEALDDIATDAALIGAIQTHLDAAVRDLGQVTKRISRKTEREKRRKR